MFGAWGLGFREARKTSENPASEFDSDPEPHLAMSYLKSPKGPGYGYGGYFSNRHSYSDCRNLSKP